jgi:hypothetical protein
MSLTHEVTVWCDGDYSRCNVWEAASGITAKDLRRVLRRKGWGHAGRNDLCPRCYAKEKAGRSRNSDEGG